jgi:hypothetical protein
MHHTLSLVCHKVIHHWRLTGCLTHPLCACELFTPLSPDTCECGRELSGTCCMLPACARHIRLLAFVLGPRALVVSTWTCLYQHAPAGVHRGTGGVHLGPAGANLGLLMSNSPDASSFDLVAPSLGRFVSAWDCLCQHSPAAAHLGTARIQPGPAHVNRSQTGLVDPSMPMLTQAGPA